MMTLVEILSRYAEEQPDTYLAADSLGVSLTYSESWSKVRKVATALNLQWHLAKKDCVMALCNQSVDYLVLYLACVLAGCVFVPVDKQATVERINMIAEETGSKLFIIPNKKEAYYNLLVAEYSEVLSFSGPANDFQFPDPDDIAEILYTTGTTGRSKGIAITNRANIALAENVKFGVSMRKNNVELIPLTMSHSHGLRTFYANLLNGSTVVLTNGVMNVKQVFQLMEQFKVTSLDLSPSAVQFLIRLAKDMFWQYAKKLDYIEIGTAHLPEELKSELVENLPDVRLYNFYGSTESGRVCALDFNAHRDKKKCIGKPSRNAEIIFTDDERKPIQASLDTPGLLASRGPMNMTGYWKNEDLTRKILINGYVCTNDTGYIDEEGYVYVLGRKDDVINFNGTKISPVEVEEAAMLHEGVSEAACVGKPDAVAGQIPRLFIVPKDKKIFNVNEFTRFLGEHIDKNKMPKNIFLLDELPKTFNGKLNRKELSTLD